MLDGDRPTVEDDPLFRIASHVIFSSECLRETTGTADLAAGLQRIARRTDAFLAVSNGPDDIVFLRRPQDSPASGVQDRRRRYARRRRRLPRRFRAGAGGRPRRSRSHALWRCGCRHQMHPARRFRRRAACGRKSRPFWPSTADKRLVLIWNIFLYRRTVFRFVE